MGIRIRTQWTDSRGSWGLHICRGMINTNDNLEDQTSNLKGKDYSMQTRDPSRNRKQIIRQNAYGSEMGTDWIKNNYPDHDIWLGIKGTHKRRNRTIRSNVLQGTQNHRFSQKWQLRVCKWNFGVCKMPLLMKIPMKINEFW